MATCKDCIHEKACTEMLKAQGYEVSADYKGNADRCDTFKNKADVVEVVRCKDCKHWSGITFGNICRRWTGLNVKNCTNPTDFCSYGERRENNAE